MLAQTAVEKLSTYGGAVGRVAKTVSMLSGLINSEVKYLDTAMFITITNTGSAYYSFTDVAEGDDTNQRNGRWILAKSLQTRWTISVPPAQTQPVQIGWALVMDKKASIGLSATPWTDVFTFADPHSPINRADSDRFVILRRGVFDSNPAGAISQPVKVYFPLKGIHVKFNGTLGTNHDQNRLILVTTCNAALNQPVLTGYARFDYYDN